MEIFNQMHHTYICISVEEHSLPYLRTYWLHILFFKKVCKTHLLFYHYA